MRLAREAVEHIHRITGLWEDLPFVWPLAVDLSRSAGESASLNSLMGLAGQSDRTAAIPLALRAHWARSAGLLAQEAGDLAEAERLLRSAVDGFAAWGSVPYGARAALELAACLDELGRSDEAETLRRPAVARPAAARRRGLAGAARPRPLSCRAVTSPWRRHHLTAR